MMTLLLLSLVAGAEGEDARLESAFKTYLAALCELQPTTATGLGDHSHDHRLDDLTPVGRKKQEALTTDTLAALEKIAAAKLSASGKIDLDIFKTALKRDKWMAENVDAWANDPLMYNGCLSDSVYQIFASSTTSSPPSPTCSRPSAAGCSAPTATPSGSRPTSSPWLNI